MSFRDRLKQGGGLLGGGALQGLGAQGLNAASLLVPGGGLLKGFGSKLMNRRRMKNPKYSDPQWNPDLASAGMDPTVDSGMGSVGYAGSTAIDPSVAMEDPMLSAGVNGRQFEPVSPMARNGKNDPPRNRKTAGDLTEEYDEKKHGQDVDDQFFGKEKGIDYDPPETKIR